MQGGQRMNTERPGLMALFVVLLLHAAGERDGRASDSNTLTQSTATHTMAGCLSEMITCMRVSSGLGAAVHC
jgi:hypothetical protein